MSQISNFVVTKSNALIQASYKLNLNEQRLVLACVAQLDGRKPMPKDNLFTVQVADFAEIYGIPLNQAYEALGEAAKTLYERDIKVCDGRVKERFRWIYHVKYHEGDAKVTVGFSPTVAPYLTLLNQQFISYQLKRVSGLGSPYSIRLFEMLSQYRGTGAFYVRLDDFKAWLEVEEKYPRFFDLCKRVIDPAVGELKAKSGLDISWRALRKGRSVDRLEFVFREAAGQPDEGKKPSAATPKHQEKKIFGVPVSEIERLARPGETYETAAMRIAKSQPAR